MSVEDMQGKVDLMAKVFLGRFRRINASKILSNLLMKS